MYGSNYGQAETVLRKLTAALEVRAHCVSTIKGDAVPADLAVEDFDAAVARAGA